MNQPTFYPAEDFLEVRKQGIGASDVANICGVGYGTPLSTFCEKTGRIVVEDNALMRRGRRFEPLVLEEFREEFEPEGMLVGGTEATKMIWRHPKYDWAFCHPDALVQDGNAEPIALVQAKLTSTYKGWGTMALGEVPEHIQYQVQWEMFCSGLTDDYVPVLMGNREFRIYHCRAIPDLQKAIFEQVLEFKENYLDKDIMPEPTGSEADTKALKALLPQSQEKEAEATAELIQLVKQLKERKDILDNAVHDHSLFVNLIKVEMDDAEVLNLDDCKIRFKTQERKSFNYKQLCSDKDISQEVIDEYKKVTTSRPFVPKWKEE